MIAELSTRKTGNGICMKPKKQVEQKSSRRQIRDNLIAELAKRLHGKAKRVLLDDKLVRSLCLVAPEASSKSPPDDPR